MISSFTLSFSLFCLLMSVIASAMLRTSSARFAVKMIVPAIVVGLVCVTSLELPSVFGYPVETAFASLPEKAELIAFVSHDEDKKVSLWLMRDGAAEPRAYSVELTESLKKTLQQAQKAKGAGERTMLAKGGKPGNKRPHQQYSNIDGGDSPYILLPAAFQLPAKEAAQ
jgi:hypothetical protein